MEKHRVGLAGPVAAPYPLLLKSCLEDHLLGLQGLQGPALEGNLDELNARLAQLQALLGTKQADEEETAELGALSGSVAQLQAQLSQYESSCAELAQAQLNCPAAVAAAAAALSSEVCSAPLEGRRAAVRRRRTQKETSAAAAAATAATAATSTSAVPVQHNGPRCPDHIEQDKPLCVCVRVCVVDAITEGNPCCSVMT